jgi:nucleoside-diphosphate-sugar epimerase
MRSKVVVTGATGLVGSHLLIRLVEEDNEIIALFRNDNAIKIVEQLFEYYGKSSKFSKISWQRVDVLDQKLLFLLFENTTTVYHTAALVSFEKKDADRLYKTNVEGTKNVLSAVEKNQVSRLVFISSVASIRNKDEEGLFTADAIIDGGRDWTDYARSKMQSEELVLNAKEKGLSTIIVNPGVILGPGDITKSSTVIFNTIKQGLSFYTLGVNGFVDVRDVIDSVFKLQNIDLVKDRYVCVGDNIQFKKLFIIIANALGVKAPKFKANKLLLAIAWRIEFVLSKIQKRTPKITKDNTSSALGKIEYSSRNLISDTGIRFRSMKEASENAANFFKFLEG